MAWEVGTWVPAHHGNGSGANPSPSLGVSVDKHVSPFDHNLQQPDISSNETDEADAGIYRKVLLTS